MRKTLKVLAAVAFAAAAAGPATALSYPQACQPTMSDIMYYDDDFDPGNGVTGADAHWCDGHNTFLGRPDVYSWTEYCNICP